jgi:hypothetical protein
MAARKVSSVSQGLLLSVRKTSQMYLILQSQIFRPRGTKQLSEPRSPWHLEISYSRINRLRQYFK